MSLLSKNKIIFFSIIFLVLLSSIGTLTGNVNVKAFSPGQRQLYDRDKNCATNTAIIPTMKQFPTTFNCGHLTFFSNGTTLRKFTLIIEENHSLPITIPADTQNKAVMFPAWTFNASIPGPTMRMTVGDHVEVTVINKGTMPHSLHMHSIHPGNQDGVPIVSGDSGFIPPGKQFTYRFTAAPIGIFVYHCHMNPVAEHINRGLYGAMIIDPPISHARPAAHEVVMYLSGADLDLKADYPRMITFDEAQAALKGNESDSFPQEHDNSIYMVNGMANYYMHNPINVTLHEPLRVYVFNMLDFEENSFHLHGQVFQYYPSGTSNNPAFTNDVVSLSQGDRGILETKFNLPGLYMAHAHIEQIGGRGWSSLFSVK